MTRILVLAWGCLLGALGVAMAKGPAEAPPTGFAAHQYIDSRGCAYQRDAAGWVARLDLDGRPVCGYPPSVAAAPGPGHAAPDPSLAMPGMDAVEARLLAAVTGEMRPGEFVGAARPHVDDRAASLADLSAGPAATVADLVPPGWDDPALPSAAPPSDAPPSAAHPSDAPPATAHPSTVEPSRMTGAADGLTTGEDLTAAIAAAPAIAAAGAGTMHPSRRLCALIGAAPHDGATDSPGLGSGAAQGYCTTALLAGTGAVLSASPEAGPDHAAASLPPLRAALASGPTAPLRHSATTAKRRPGGAGKRQAPEGGRPVPTGRAASPAAGSRAAAEAMIPAGARWLEVGRFADPTAADAAARRLAAAGFAVGRSPSGGRVAVMAGPFATRQAIVTARDRLIRSGWRGVVAR